jgi:transcriptional antiterminator RfaH
MVNNNSPWYVLRSKSQKEDALYQFASMRGYTVYYPKLRVDPVNPRSRHVVPFFPGYMFVRADFQEVGVSSFQWMPYSLGLVSFGSTPGKVPDAMVTGIQRRLEEQNEKQPVVDGFEPGERLIVKQGPLAGFEALFEKRLRGQDRVRVLMKLLNGKWARTNLDSAVIGKWDG